MMVKEIQDATKNDETLQRLAEIIRKQTWNSINDIQTLDQLRLKPPPMHRVAYNQIKKFRV